MTKRVLNIGNCSFDYGTMNELISANFDAEVVAAATRDEALERLRTDCFDLILVNRILLGDSSDGVELIEYIRANAQLASTPVMLLSNYAEAQQSAVVVGAEAGFGKAELDSAETLEKLARFLGT
jgi:CheY-like chemotaxis protein